MLSGQQNLCLAAEMIVPQEVLDEFDQVVEPSRTYLRYEVELAFVPDPARGGVKTLRLASEMLKPLSVRSSLFDAYPRLADAVGGRRVKPYLSLEQVQDGRARVISVPREMQGRPRQISTEKSQRTVLSAMASAEYPTLLAARAASATRSERRQRSHADFNDAVGTSWHR